MGRRCASQAPVKQRHFRRWGPYVPWVFLEDPIKKRTSGGSIPISPFVTTLNVPALTYPSVNKDNNQHSPNENIRVGNFIDGTLGMVYLLLEDID